MFKIKPVRIAMQFLIKQSNDFFIERKNEISKQKIYISIELNDEIVLKIVV